MPHKKNQHVEEEIGRFGGETLRPLALGGKDHLEGLVSDLAVRRRGGGRKEPGGIRALGAFFLSILEDRLEFPEDPRVGRARDFRQAVNRIFPCGRPDRSARRCPDASPSQSISRTRRRFRVSPSSIVFPVSGEELGLPVSFVFSTARVRVTQHESAPACRSHDGNETAASYRISISPMKETLLERTLGKSRAGSEGFILPYMSWNLGYRCIFPPTSLFYEVARRGALTDFGAVEILDSDSISSARDLRTYFVQAELHSDELYVECGCPSIERREDLRAHLAVIGPRRRVPLSDSKRYQNLFVVSGSGGRKIGIDEQVPPKRLGASWGPSSRMHRVAP